MRIFKLFLVFLLLLFSLPVNAEQDQTLPEGIMAIRGDGVVSRQMFDAKVSRIPVKDRNFVLRSGERVKKILLDLVLNSQLATDARAAGFDTGEILVRMQLAAEAELATAWLDYRVESQPDADYRSMAHEYYLLHQDRFESAPSRDVTHLLVSTEQRTVDEAEEIAQSLLDQVNSDPSEFDQLVIEHSEDESVRSNQGHFIAMKKGEMVEPFEDAAFSLQEPGDFSGLVQSRFGFHIIRLDQIHPTRTLAFDEVNMQLELVQKQQHKDRFRYAYLNELSSMDWQISDEAIKAMVISYFGEDQVQQDSITPETE